MVDSSVRIEYDAPQEPQSQRDLAVCRHMVHHLVESDHAEATQRRPAIQRVHEDRCPCGSPADQRGQRREVGRSDNWAMSEEVNASERIRSSGFTSRAQLRCAGFPSARRARGCQNSVWPRSASLTPAREIRVSASAWVAVPSRSRYGTRATASNCGAVDLALHVLERLGRVSREFELGHRGRGLESSQLLGTKGGCVGAHDQLRVG